MEDNEIIERLSLIEKDLKAYANKLTKDYHEAQDLFQDTYLKVWTNRDRYREDKAFRSWCHTIMYNLFITSKQNKAKERLVTLPEGINNYIKESTEFTMHHSSTYGYINATKNQGEDNISIDDIFDCINTTLKGVHKEIVLKKISGEDYKEIAVQVNLSITNCKVKYWHSIRKIRKQLRKKFSITSEYDEKPNLLVTNRIYHSKQSSADTTYRKRFPKSENKK